MLNVLFSACVHHSSEDEILHVENTTLPEIELQYAKGFEVHYERGNIKIITHAINQNAPFRDSLYVVFNSRVKFPPTIKRINYGQNRLACQSSTYLAFLTPIEQLDAVCGLCGIEYIADNDLKNTLISNQVIEICASDQLEIEALYASAPDLVLEYPFGNEDQADLSKKGLKTLLMGEYLEESQLARLEWIKLVGLLVGEAEKANAYFDKVEAEYQQLCAATQPSGKTFIMNLPFQDQWFMPAAQSVGVQLIEDAGLTYFYGTEAGTENKLHSEEAVWNAGVTADYWIIIADEAPDFSMDDLEALSPVYKTFKSVQNGQVIFCNIATTDYFAKGVIEPHIILKDLLFATGQLEDHNPAYFYLLE